MDYLSLEPSKGGCANILVITDHFTRYAVAIPTRNQTAKVTAKVLFENFIVHYGFMERLHSDQGRNFESQIVAHLCNLAGIEKSRTTPYHPMGNGMTERFNQSLLNMLGTLEEEQKIDWKAYVAPLVHAYNCTRHESTGYAPYELMFGRLPKLSIDVYLGIQGKSTGEEYCEYVNKLRQRLKFAYEVASKQAGKSAVRYKKAYDCRARESVLKQGDLVLVKRVASTGKQKLEDRWEKDLYEVEDKPSPDIPVYVVKRVSGKGPKRTLHRNLLLPYGGLPVENPVTDKGQSDSGSHSMGKKNLPELEISRQVQEDWDESDASDEDRYIEVEVEPQGLKDHQVLQGEGQPEDYAESSTGSALDKSDSESSSSSPVPLRRSTRVRNQPDRYVPSSMSNQVSQWDCKSKAKFMLGVIGQCTEQNKELCLQLMNFVEKN
jgi:transposase InsO family protein